MAWDIHWLAAVIVGGFFALTGVGELVMWRKHVSRFVAWGYPHWFPIFLFSLKIAAGILVFIPQARIIGLILCSLICVGAVATLIVRKDELLPKALPVNIGLIALSVLSYWTAP